MNDSGIRALWARRLQSLILLLIFWETSQCWGSLIFHPWPQRYLLYLTSCNSLISPSFPTVHPQAGITHPPGFCVAGALFKTTQLLSFLWGPHLGDRKLMYPLPFKLWTCNFSDKSSSPSHLSYTQPGGEGCRLRAEQLSSFLSSSSHPYCSQVMQMIKTTVRQTQWILTNFLKRSIF